MGLTWYEWTMIGLAIFAGLLALIISIEEDVGERTYGNGKPEAERRDQFRK